MGGEDEDDDMNLAQMYMYSVHDISLVRVMNSLGVYNDIPPPYSSALIFMLEEDSRGGGGQLIVSLSYRNGSSLLLHQLTIPGCGAHFCPLDRFQEIVKDFQVDDWDKECRDYP